MRPWWQFDPDASLHARVTFHLWRALACGLVLGLIAQSLVQGLLFAVLFGTFSALLSEFRRHRSRGAGGTM
jgi:hypothetical protein